MDATLGDQDGGCGVLVSRQSSTSPQSGGVHNPFVWQQFMLITFLRPSAHVYILRLRDLSMHSGRGGVLNGCHTGTNNREFPGQELLCLFVKRDVLYVKEYESVCVLQHESHK